MSKYTSHTKPQNDSPSALDRVNLTFEYNISWAEEKKMVKERTS